MQLISLDNILYVDSEEYGDRVTLTIYPSDANTGKVIEVSGEKKHVKIFFSMLSLSQQKCIEIPKNLTMNVKSV